MIEAPLGVLASSIEDYVGAVTTLAEDADWEFLSASVARETWSNEPYAADWGDQPVQDALRTSMLVFTSVLDHAKTLADSLRSGRTFASYTLARSLAETSARSWYLMEPGLNHREWTRRLMNERLYILHEDYRLMQAVPGADLHHRETRDRILATAARFGFAVIREDRDGRRPAALDKPRPGIMSILNDMYRDHRLGSTFYRHASAVAHGSTHGLVKLMQFRTREDSSLRMRPEPLTASAAAPRIAPGAIAMMRATEVLVYWTGWPHEPVWEERAAFEQVWRAQLDLAGDSTTSS